MNIRQLKNIMKEVNEPNEFFLEPDELQHPLYWIFKVDGGTPKYLILLEAGKSLFGINIREKTYVLLMCNFLNLSLIKLNVR